MQLDQGQNDESWQSMSALFQAFNDQARWKIRQQVIRASYGPLISREFKNVSDRTTFCLSPNGEYVIVQLRIKLPEQSRSDRNRSVRLQLRTCVLGSGIYHPVTTNL